MRVPMSTYVGWVVRAVNLGSPLSGTNVSPRAPRPCACPHTRARVRQGKPRCRSVPMPRKYKSMASGCSEPSARRASAATSWVFSVAFDLPAIGIAEPGAASGGQWRMGSGGKQNCPVHKGAELDQLDVEKSRGDQQQLMKVLVGLSGVVSFQHKDDAARNGGRVSFAKQTG
jgi:hypothetical protein